LTPNQLKQRAASYVRGDNVEVTIMPNSEYYRVDYDNLKQCLVGDVAEQADRTVRSLIEMTTSQYLINNDKYQMVSAGTLFDKNAVPLMDNRGAAIHGMDMRVGFKKGARVTCHDVAKPFIFLDMKRSAFFSTKLMSEIYAQMVRGDRDKVSFERFFRGVRMQLVYDPSRTFLFGQLSRFNINDKEYSVDGLTVPQYMKQKKSVELRALNIPGIHPDQPNGRSVVYPIECIRPLEGQLVPTEKLTVFAIRALLAENSVQPGERLTYCNQQLAAISQGEGAKFLEKFGFSILSNSNVLQIVTNPLPKINVGGNSTITPKPNGSWNDEVTNAKFLSPTTKLKKWIVAFDREAINGAFARNYIKNLMAEAQKAGLTLPEPLEFIETTFYGLENLFKKASADKVQFLFYIDSQRTKSHGRLKLFEAYYKVLTQQVIEKNLKNGAQTLKNVLLKLNVKGFGLNYVPIMNSPLLKDLKLESTDLLIIGYDVALPERVTGKELHDFYKKNGMEWVEGAPKIKNIHPAAVGICANKGANSFSFSGDLFYQKADGGLIDPDQLALAVENIVVEAYKHRKPTRLIVFRDGVSEGEQSKIVLQELPAIRKGFMNGMKRTSQTANVQVKITFIVATKMHGKRFYRVDGQKTMNTRVGDSMRMTAIRSDVKEYYVQSHHPLKGVPRVPQFDVLVDEIGIPIPTLEQFTVYLSNMHQVSSCPTSLPLPVYLADETAKRAEEIYKALRFYRNERDGSRFAPEIQLVNGMYDTKSLNEKLRYFGHPLYGTRFNA